MRVVVTSASQSPVSSQLQPSTLNPPVAPSLWAPEDQSRWFSEHVHVHESRLKAYLHGSFPSVRDVDDVVQESYLRVWKARAVHPIESAKGFLFTVARHIALKVALKNRNAPVEFVGDLSTSMLVEDKLLGPADALNYNEKVSLLAEALTRLPARCREIVILRKLQGLSQKEVAAKLGLSERTVENQIARGISHCQNFFRERNVHTLF